MTDTVINVRFNTLSESKPSLIDIQHEMQLIPLTWNL